MNSLEANIRNTKTKGELNSLRDNGHVPAIIYGGEAQNEKISVSKKILKSLAVSEENMKLLTHNMLTSKCMKAVTTGYPLAIQARDVKVVQR